MVRVTIKGGVWRNTEDEILKAAVMKYGKNQWSRIASLLHRKSAKQCKARWFEWLDPSIKKTEWSREEDEKLLHMAKLMPTQWRTIAPIVGRTAAQCLERYEYLLDQAQKKGEGEEEHDDPRKLKPGEIDPHPETKPARPDPIDMDEDELEMLSEARARLANTQGKKAKRKAREKQLEEARRLASLQKRRELKAAGIPVRRLGYGGKRLKTMINYNQEIPFQKAPAIGFYDTENEVFDKEKWKETHKTVIEAKPNKYQEKQQKRKENENKEDNFVEPQNEPLRKRSKLVLPTPQISDKELEEVVKLGQASEYARQQAVESGTPFTGGLLGDYTMTPDLSKLRTPMIQSGHDSILQEAQNIMALQVVDTPLKGGLNTPLHENGYSTSAPTPKVAPTPNTMFQTPFRTPTGEINATPLRTPNGIVATQGSQTPALRDKLSINPDEAFSNDDKIKQREIREQLRQGFAKLPTPKNDYDIVVPEEESMETSSLEDVQKNNEIEDQADIDEKLRHEKIKNYHQELKKRSQVIQRELIRPTDINLDILRPIDQGTTLNDYQNAEELIKKEMLIMLNYDSLKNPTLAQCGLSSNYKKPPNVQLKPLNEPKYESFLRLNKYEEFTEDELNSAKHLLEVEVPQIKELMGHDLTFDGYTQVWDECYAQVLYIPNQNRFTRASVASRKEKIESLEKRLEMNRSLMAKEAKRASKLEQKMKILLGGYQTRAQSLIKSIQDTSNQIESSYIELLTFEQIRQHEMNAIPKRVDSLTNDLKKQEEREAELQKKFGDLIFERDQLIKSK